MLDVRGASSKMVSGGGAGEVKIKFKFKVKRRILNIVHPDLQLAAETFTAPQKRVREGLRKPQM
jgi:hypothetical protein